jgi:pimeloyl-ACP methyl ester carboxylesterase
MNMELRETMLIKYATTDGLDMYGALFKSKPNNKKIIIHEHGMCSNFFNGSMTEELSKTLKGTDWDFLSTNNRGFNLTSKFVRNNKKEIIGTAYEEFTDCIKDIDGAINAMKKLGYKEIILSGQSTGCQKVTYYQAKKQNNLVKALILLAPADDYSATKKELGEKFNKAVKIAEKLTKEGKRKQLMPTKYSLYSAKRFLSFANEKNTEAELFNYTGKLKTFSKLNLPILAIFGEKEENVGEQTPKEMLNILEAKTQSKLFRKALIKNASHNFKENEKETAKIILEFLNKIEK